MNLPSNKNSHMSCSEKVGGRLLSLCNLLFLAAIFFTFPLFFTGCGGDTSEVSSDGSILSLADPIPPTNTIGVTTNANFINAGAVTTANVDVTLTISATDNVGVAGYCVIESDTVPPDPLFNDACFNSITETTSYIAAVPFTLTATSGTKNVHIWFRDGEGVNVSNVVSTSIEMQATSGFQAVAKGSSHTLAIDSSGLVYAWGDNTEGKLGDGTTSQRNSPVNVMNSGGGYFSGVDAVAAGNGHSLALKSDGTVWAWGGNSDGRLGDDTNISRHNPVQVRFDWNGDGIQDGFLTDVIAIAVGGEHNLAVRSNHTLWAWGRNDYGQLGNGTANNVDLASRVLASGGGNFPFHIDGEISAGLNFSLVRNQYDEVWAWGENSDAQLGDGTYIDQYYPVQVKYDDGTNFNFNEDTVIDAGESHNIALKTVEGTVWTWGRNLSGVLGVGTQPGGRDLTLSPHPVQVRTNSPPAAPTYLTDVIAISAARFSNLALKNDGTLWGWGRNSSYQLGVGGDNVDRFFAEQVLESEGPDVPFLGADQIAAGTSHSLALKGGFLYAWGSNYAGQLGTGNYDDQPFPVVVRNSTDTDNLTGVIAISAGNTHSLALMSDGSVMSWGANYREQLGDPLVVLDRNLPGYVRNSTDTDNLNIGAGGVIDAGYEHNLVIIGDGSGNVWSWGDCRQSQCGDNTWNNIRSLPVQMLRSTITPIRDVIGISAGRYHSVLKYQAVYPFTYAWYAGQVNYGSFAYNRYAQQISGAGSDVYSIAAGYSHKCAVVKSGPSNVAMAWGSNLYGQIGDGTYWNRQNPSYVKNNDGSAFIATHIAAGGYHSLAIVSGGKVWSWGLGANGQNGSGRFYIGNLTSSRNKVKPDHTWVYGMVEPDDWFPDTGVATAIAAGNNFSQAVIDDGMNKKVYAVGSDTTGQLGYNSSYSGFWYVAKNINATDFTIDSDNLANGSSAYHALAIKDDGSLWSWGNNFNGQVGDGTDGAGTNKQNPVPVTMTSGLIDVAAGGQHSLILKGGKDVWSVGWIEAYQMDITAPYQVEEDGSGPPVESLSQISAGYNHSVVLKDDNSVWAFGDNWWGQLGKGTDGETDVLVGCAECWKYGAVQVLDESGLPSLTGIDAVAAGGEHSLAIKNDGTVLAWGRDFDGELGNSSVLTYSNIPVLVDRGDSTSDTSYLGDGTYPIIDISGGYYHSLALKSDGTVWSWGWNDAGQLGDGSFDSSDTPVQVTGLTNIIAISAGGFHSVALKNDGSVWAWGHNSWGQLGNVGISEDSSTPVQATGLTNIVEIAAGGYHTVALKTTFGLPNTVFAWGKNGEGQLGNASQISSTSSVQVMGKDGVGFLEDIISIDAGGDFSMAVTNDFSEAWSWGGDYHGQSGDVDEPNNSINKINLTPVNVDI